MKLYLLPVVFFRKNFHLNLVFIFVSYFIIVPLISTTLINFVFLYPNFHFNCSSSIKTTLFRRATLDKVEVRSLVGI